MGIEKSEIKMAVAHDIGCSLDDMLEGSKADVHRWEGSKTACKTMCSSIDKLIQQHIKRDVEEGNLSIEEAEFAKRWVLKVRGLAENLVLNADAMICVSKGKAQALEQAVRVTKKVYDSEEQKKAALETPVSEDEKEAERPDARPVGRHPGLTDIQKRREEAKAEKTKAAEKKAKAEKAAKARAAAEKAKAEAKAEAKAKEKAKPAPKKAKKKVAKKVAKKTARKAGPRSPHLPATLK